MKIGHIELVVRNPRKSVKFYCETLGFKLVQNQDDLFYWIELNGVEILLKPGKVMQAAQFKRTPINIVFYTDDLPQTKTNMEKNGVKFAGEDQGCPLFRDPDGHWFQLVNPENQS